MRTKRIETGLDVLVASVYLLNVADKTGALGTHGGNEQGYTCTDVGT